MRIILKKFIFLSTPQKKKVELTEEYSSNCSISTQERKSYYITVQIIQVDMTWIRLRKEGKKSDLFFSQKRNNIQISVVKRSRIFGVYIRNRSHKMLTRVFLFLADFRIYLARKMRWCHVMSPVHSRKGKVVAVSELHNSSRFHPIPLNELERRLAGLALDFHPKWNSVTHSLATKSVD